MTGWCSLLPVILLTAAADGGAATSFGFFDESVVAGPDFGVVMTCPAHDQGPREGVRDRLLALIAAHPPDGPPATLWVCRTNQIDTLRAYGRLAERVVVNPFVHLDRRLPAPDHAVWPGVDHPIVNQVRRVRDAVHATDDDASGPPPALLALIDVAGEPKRFDERKASLEEVRWMAVTAIGAGYRGIVWRRGGRPSQLANFQSALRRHGAALGQAQPLAGAAVADAGPCAALLGDDTLFLCLLHPAMMRLSDAGDDALVVVALDRSPRDFVIDLSDLGGRAIESMVSLSGMPATVVPTDGGTRVRYRLTGGAQILVGNLKAEVE